MTDSLRAEFPDLSVSTLHEVLKNYGNDEHKAQQALKLFEQEENRKEKERKFVEVRQMFSDLPELIVKKVLEDVDYDVEQALIPLFNELTKQQTKEAKIEEEIRQKEEMKKKKEEEERNRKESIKYLMEIFQGIDINEIQEILEQNEGDVEETVNVLSGIIQQREQIEKEKEQAMMKEEQEQALKQLKMDALKEKFPELSLNDEILPCLEQVNWNIKDACKYLNAVTSNKMVNKIKNIFKTMNDDEITEILEKVDWKVEKGIEYIGQQLKLKELQEKERKEKQEREIKEREEVEMEKRRKEEEQEKKRKDEEEEERRKREEEIERRRRKEEEEEETRKMEESILEKSVRLEEEITKKREVKKTVVMNEFKMNLNTILTQQIRDNKGQMPGLVPPPTVNEINVRLGLIPPPIDELETSVTTKEEVKLPTPVPEITTSTTSNNNITTTITSNSSYNIDLQIKTNRVDIGQTIIVEYNVKEGNVTNYDWIALYEVTQPNKNYITYQWTKQSKSGQLTFLAPSTYGTYECRYLVGRSYEHVARSNPVSVGPLVQLSASLEKETNKIRVKYSKQSGNEYKRAWIGIYELNQLNNKFYLHYEYASNTTGEILFEAPIKPATYEFRYFTSSYLEISKSNPIVIDGQDQFDINVEGELIKFKVNLLSVDPSRDGVWIGLFLESESNNREWRRYKYVTQRNQEGSFNRPKHNGTYQARVFANKSYEPIWKSNAFILS